MFSSCSTIDLCQTVKEKSLMCCLLEIHLSSFCMSLRYSKVSASPSSHFISVINMSDCTHIYGFLCKMSFYACWQVWRKLFSPLHALNFGVGGDATQHVLWRLVNGELDHISPKVVVLWVGTNNHGHTPEQICGGIMAIINVIHQKLPHAHTLVLGLLPRGKSPNPLRERNASVNALVQAEVASLSHVSFLDMDPGFILSDGSIAHQDMYDYLHLTPQAYQKCVISCRIARHRGIWKIYTVDGILKITKLKTRIGLNSLLR
uniref:Platelet-activating factor acetylhydrolase IB subunit alpha1 n=1 Tax=Cyprinus carpio carpio TaxID=630221 RepID=A0A9J8DMD8_CYPCA